MLRADPDRRAKGLAPSPDPRLCLVDDLLKALEARDATEGRRSIGRLRFGTDQLLRLFKGVQAMRVSGADILRYDLRVTAPRSPEAGTPDPSVLGHDREAGSVTAVGLESHRQQESIRYQIRGVEAARMWLLWRSIP